MDGAGRNGREIAGHHGAGLVVGPHVDRSFQTEKHVVSFAVEVEADGGGLRTAAADDGERVVGFFPRDEEARGREGARDVDDLAA